MGHLLTYPDTGVNVTGLQADLDAGLKGRTVLIPTTSGGWGGGVTQSPLSDLVPRRLGGNPPPTVREARDSVNATIVSSAGIPPTLISPMGDGTSMREAFRQFLHSTVMPVSDIIKEELSNKLDTPDLSISFDRLMASDVQGRARAFQSMVGGGMAVEKAAMLSGLMEPM